jgi:hypothetical protein
VDDSLDLPSPPDDVVNDDHLLSSWAATVTGERLEALRTEGLQGRELKDAGDALGHRILMSLLARYRADDAVLVMPRDRAQDVKLLVDRLKAAGRCRAPAVDVPEPRHRHFGPKWVRNSQLSHVCRP